MTTQAALQQTIAEMVLEGKGILAADESTLTTEKRFKAIHVSSTEEIGSFFRVLQPKPLIPVLDFRISATHWRPSGVKKLHNRL